MNHCINLDCSTLIIGDLNVNMLKRNNTLTDCLDKNTFVCSGYENESVKHTLLQNVNNMISWSKNNNMKVNPDKFQCNVFGRNDNLGSFKIDVHE